MTNKEIRETVLKEMEARAAGCREISLREAANAVGVKHIKTEECQIILNRFCKKHPSFRAVKMLKSENDKITSLFCGAVVTELEYD